jgi:hypothetical protein
MVTRRQDVSLTAPEGGRNLKMSGMPAKSRPATVGVYVKRAIISDVHGNLEALQAVLEDIDREQVDAIVCLGDIVGYGPNPCECVKLVRDRCGLVILGNHDQGALFDPDGFNSAGPVANSRCTTGCRGTRPIR